MKARIITTVENTKITDKEKLYTVHKEIASGITEDYIAYNSSNGSIEVKVGLNKKEPNKAISCSELIQKMIKKDWLNPKKIFIDNSNSDNFVVRKLKDVLKKQPSPLYTVTPPTNQEQETESILLTTSDSITDYEFNKLWNSAFVGIEDGDNIKKQVENMAINGEINLYNTSREMYDLLGGNNTVTLIDTSSDVYTNSLDIKPILYNAVIDSNTTAKIDLSIQYSKVNDNSLVYNSDITFKGFSTIIDNTEKISIKFNNVFQTINDDVIVEFVDGLIRLFPKNENILECIISNCTVTYGNLN